MNRPILMGSNLLLFLNLNSLFSFLINTNLLVFILKFTKYFFIKVILGLSLKKIFVSKSIGFKVFKLFSASIDEMLAFKDKKYSSISSLNLSFNFSFNIHV